jgi:hypothetical protein
MKPDTYFNDVHNSLNIKGYNIYDFTKEFFSHTFQNLTEVTPYYRDYHDFLPSGTHPFIVISDDKSQIQTTDFIFFVTNYITDGHYALTSITLQNYNKDVGHAAGLYYSENRYYAWEGKVRDMHFLEHTILKLDLDVDIWTNIGLFFNSHKERQICIYTPSMFVFTSNEIALLRKLASFLYYNNGEEGNLKTRYTMKYKNLQSVSKPKCSLFQCFRPTKVDIDPPLSSEVIVEKFAPPISFAIAILLYFNTSITIEIANLPANPSSTKVVPVRTFTLNCVYSGNNVTGESRQYNLDIPIPGTTPISISIPNSNHENAFFLAIVDTLNTTPYLTEFNKETKLVNITHMKCRYAIQEKTIINMMKLVKMYVEITPTQKGGRPKKSKEIIMKKTKKVYKVKKTKDGNKYIMINKNKVFLKDIKGRYTLRRD